LRVVHAKTDAHAKSIPIPNLVSGEELLGAFIVTSDAAPSARRFQRLADIHDGMALLPEETSEPREVLFFISSRTGMQVKRAAVGAEGFVVDHYVRAAVEHYLQHIGDRLMQAFSADRPYSVFCDSLEVYASDWTADLLQEFQKRRGYDFFPHLPELTEGHDERT